MKPWIFLCICIIKRKSNWAKKKYFWGSQLTQGDLYMYKNINVFLFLLQKNSESVTDINLSIMSGNCSKSLIFLWNFRNNPTLFDYKFRIIHSWIQHKGVWERGTDERWVFFIRQKSKRYTSKLTFWTNHYKGQQRNFMLKMLILNK